MQVSDPPGLTPWLQHSRNRLRPGPRGRGIFVLRAARRRPGRPRLCSPRNSAISATTYGADAEGVAKQEEVHMRTLSLASASVAALVADGALTTRSLLRLAVEECPFRLRVASVERDARSRAPRNKTFVKSVSQDERHAAPRGRATSLSSWRRSTRGAQEGHLVSFVQQDHAEYGQAELRQASPAQGGRRQDEPRRPTERAEELQAQAHARARAAMRPPAPSRALRAAALEEGDSSGSRSQASAT